MQQDSTYDIDDKDFILFLPDQHYRLYISTACCAGLIDII